MLTTQQAISNLLDWIRKGLIADMNDKNMKASGRTEKSLRVVANNEDGELYGAKSIGALIDGRGPTKLGNSGGPTLREAILQWIDDKGIQPETGTREGLSWAISKSIHKKGTRALKDKSKRLDFKGVVKIEMKRGKADISKSVAAFILPQIGLELRKALT
jgi:hypothetical protein